MKQNKLDEMQEQALLKIEHNGCWFAFWGLLVMMAAEALLGFGVKTMAGEWIIFMALACTSALTVYDTVSGIVV